MRDNIITANAGDKLYIKTDSVFQYDYGLRLVIEGVELPESYRVHFGNKENSVAKTVFGDSTGVDVPDEYLQSGEDVHAYVFLKNEDEYGYTVYHIHIPVVDRAAIDTEAITPVEHSFVEDALQEIAENVVKTENNVLKYPYINDEGYWMVFDADADDFVNTGIKAQGDNTFDLNIGTVETLPPGAQATASITWEHGNARLNLGLPAGDSSGMVSIHDERRNAASVTIHDGANNMVLDEMIIAIEPIQSGSGTPGPRNVRRITGVTGTTITHNEDEYEISYEEAAGTVYSGKYYPLTGRLIVDKAFITRRCVDMDNVEIQPGWKNSGVRNIVGAGVDGVFSGQILNIGTSYGIDTTGDNDLLYLGHEQYGMRQSDWKNTEITVQLCIELPEPVEYLVDSVSLSTALGDNVFSVSNGKIEYLKYPCDTKKYIDHKIAETQALVLEN